MSAKLTVEEMNTNIITTESSISEAGRQMMHLKEVAAKQKDVIKLNCLNDKIIQYKARLNIWDENKATFQVALSKSAAEQEAAYQSLMGVGSAVFTLRDEAKACVGEPELFKQEAGVEVRHPPFPDDPTVGDPFDPTISDIEPPTYASPFF